jgi:hypothetical protein
LALGRVVAELWEQDALSAIPPMRGATALLRAYDDRKRLAYQQGHTEAPDDSDDCAHQ